MVESVCETLICRTCGESKPSDDFGRNAKYANKKQPDCKKCLNSRVRARLAADPQLARRRVEQSRAWQLRNKEEYEARRKAYREHQWATDPEGWREKNRRWRETERNLPPEVRRDKRLRQTYGITLADYDALLASQNACCAICRTNQPGGPWDTFAVDHCHESGQVRGLLCSACNMGIGLLGDNPQTIEAALHYLKESQNG